MKKNSFLSSVLLASLVVGLVGFAFPTPVSAAPLGGGGPIVGPACEKNADGEVRIPYEQDPASPVPSNLYRGCGSGHCCYQYGFLGTWWPAECPADRSPCSVAVAPPVVPPVQAPVALVVAPVTGTCPGGATLSATGERVDFVTFPVGKSVCSLPVGGARYVAECLGSGWNLTAETCSASYTRSGLEGLGATLRDIVAMVVSNPPAVAMGAPLVAAVNENAWWHQTALANVVMSQMIREISTREIPGGFLSQRQALERVFLRDYNTLTGEQLLGFQFSRHNARPPGADPHSYQLWVGKLPQRIVGAQQMVETRGWCPAVARSRLQTLIAEQSRLSSPADAGRLAQVQREIQMSITRFQIAQQLPEEQRLAFYRPAIFEINFADEAAELGINSQAAVVKSGQIHWDQVRSVIVGTDATAEEIRLIEAQFPGIRIHKDVRLNWSVADRREVTSALASLKNPLLDEGILERLQDPATRQATAVNVWGKLPDPVYRAAAGANDFVLYQLPQLATYAYVAYVEGQIIVDLWETAGEFNAATTNLSWPEWIMTHSTSYEELARWVPFPTVDRVTLEKDCPMSIAIPDWYYLDFSAGINSESWASFRGKPVDVYPQINVEQPLNGNRLSSGKSLGSFVLVFKGWIEGGQPLVENAGGETISLAGDPFVGFCLQEKFLLGEGLSAYQLSVRWERGPNDELRLRLIPSGRFSLPSGSCPW